MEISADTAAQLRATLSEHDYEQVMAALAIDPLTIAKDEPYLVEIHQDYNGSKLHWCEVMTWSGSNWHQFSDPVQKLAPNQAAYRWIKISSIQWDGDQRSQPPAWEPGERLARLKLNPPIYWRDYDQYLLDGGDQSYARWLVGRKEQIEKQKESILIEFCSDLQKAKSIPELEQILADYVLQHPEYALNLMDSFDLFENPQFIY